MQTTERQTRSAWKRGLHDLFISVERLWDRYRPRDADPEPLIDGYTGYATPNGCVLRGRVLDKHRWSPQIDTASRWNAARNMARNFFTDEMPGVRVTSGEVEMVTDEEGYFRLTVAPMPPGRQTAELLLPEFDVRTDAQIIVPSPKAEFGIISDIDDTVMRTGAYWLPRNLWTTATTFISNREVFPDSVALLQQLHAGINPVFFVSSSPWNLHRYLNTVFAANDVPDGPMFLRDLGISETQFIKSSHGSHKGKAIDTILAANPDLDFVLIGDSGQHDAIVYHDAIERHPGRIRRVILRHAGTIDDADLEAAEAIRRKNVDLFMGKALTPADAAA